LLPRESEVNSQVWLGWEFNKNQNKKIIRNLKGGKAEKIYSWKQTNVPKRLPKKSNYNMAKQPEPAGSGQLAN
jgi:hypothetical protein